MPRRPGKIAFLRYLTDYLKADFRMTEHSVILNVFLYLGFILSVALFIAAMLCSKIARSDLKKKSLPSFLYNKLFYQNSEILCNLGFLGVLITSRLTFIRFSRTLLIFQMVSCFLSIMWIILRVSNKHFKLSKSLKDLFDDFALLAIFNTFVFCFFIVSNYFMCSDYAELFRIMFYYSGFIVFSSMFLLLVSSKIKSLICAKHEDCQI